MIEVAFVGGRGRGGGVVVIVIGGGGGVVAVVVNGEMEVFLEKVDLVGKEVSGP